MESIEFKFKVAEIEKFVFFLGRKKIVNSEKLKKISILQ